MAAFQGIARTAEIALTAATARTVLQLIAASNHPVRILGVGVFFDGTSVTAEPAIVDLLRQTTAGTMSSLTLVKRDPGRSETLQTTGQHTATAEPTAGDIIDSWQVHPQQGYEVFYPLGQEPIIGGSGRVGIRVTAPANVNVLAKIIFEE